MAFAARRYVDFHGTVRSLHPLYQDPAHANLGGHFIATYALKSHLVRPETRAAAALGSAARLELSRNSADQSVVGQFGCDSLVSRSRNETSSID